MTRRSNSAATATATPARAWARSAPMALPYSSPSRDSTHCRRCSKPGRPARRRSRTTCGRRRSCARRALRLETVAEVESGLAHLGRVEKRRVDAVEGLAGAVVGALDREPALRQRSTRHLHAAEAVARALLLLEDGDVDLAAEDLVYAAHVAPPGGFVVERVQRRAVLRDATRRMDQPVAEAAALSALVLGCRDGRGTHWGQSKGQPKVNAYPLMPGSGRNSSLCRPARGSSASV